MKLVFGLKAPQLLDQMSRAGCRPDLVAALHWQKDVDAILRLAVRGLLTELEVTRGRKKLVLRIEAALSGKHEETSA